MFCLFFSIGFSLELKVSTPGEPAVLLLARNGERAAVISLGIISLGGPLSQGPRGVDRGVGERSRGQMSKE